MKEPKIVKNSEICGGKPIIEGTRTSVLTIGVEYEYMGMSADEIIKAHPHLNLAQVHTALSYFYQHIGEMRKKIKEDEEYIEKLKKERALVLQ